MVDVHERTDVDRRAVFVGSIRELYGKMLEGNLLLHVINRANGCRLAPEAAEIVRSYVSDRNPAWMVIVIRADKAWTDSAVQILRRQNWTFKSPAGPLSFQYREEAVEEDAAVNELAEQVVGLGTADDEDVYGSPTGSPAGGGEGLEEQENAAKRKAFSPKESEQKRDRKEEN